jgi:hypothetical protein
MLKILNMNKISKNILILGLVFSLLPVSVFAREDESERGGRFEFKGENSRGAILYDDYAHHPSEIKATLAGLKEKFPNKNPVLVASGQSIVFYDKNICLGGATIKQKTNQVGSQSWEKVDRDGTLKTRQPLNTSLVRNTTSTVERWT